MKTTVLLLGLLYLLSSGIATAQSTPPATGFRYGLKAGLNAAQIYRASSHTRILWRYNAGLTFEQRFTPTFALAGEVLYSRQGSRMIYQGILSFQKDVFLTNFDYVSVPLLLRYRPKGTRAFVEVGGQASRLIKAIYYFTYDKPKTLLTYSYATKLDFGLVGGVG